MSAACVTRRRDATAAQRMPRSDHANEAVSKQRLCTHLRPHRFSDDTGLQIDASLAQWPAVLVEFLNEAQPHRRSFGARARDQAWAEGLDEAFAGAERERSGELREANLFGGPEHRLGILHELADTIAQLQRPRCRNETASSPDQQWIACGLAQPR